MNRASKAGFWMLDYAYHAWWETRGLLSRERPTDYLGGDPHRPIVLVPGVYENWQFMHPIAAELHRRGHPVHVLPQLGRNVLTIAESAQLLADYLAEHALENVIVIAHSKGGLITKYAMLRFDGAKRIRRLIAVNSPFLGTAWAKYVRVPSIRMFEPTDLTVTFLGAESPVNERITSIYGSFDQTVTPGHTLLPGADNLQVSVAGHSRILASKALLARVVEIVDAEQPAAP